jgi:hypothetical protein
MKNFINTIIIVGFFSICFALCWGFGLTFLNSSILSAIFAGIFAGGMDFYFQNKLSDPTISINDVDVGDLFTEKFDRDITPYCEPVILSVTAVDLISGYVESTSNYGKTGIDSIEDLSRMYDLNKQSL